MTWSAVLLRRSSRLSAKQESPELRDFAIGMGRRSSSRIFLAGTDAFDDVLQRSYGWNLGISYIPGAVAECSPHFLLKAAILRGV